MCEGQTKIQCKTPEGLTISSKLLFDTGATGQFVHQDSKLVQAHTLIPYTEPRQLIMFDGRDSSAGMTTHYIIADISFHDRYPSYSVQLDVTRLTGTDVVLGVEWMRENQVNINFADNRIELPSVSIVTKRVREDTLRANRPKKIRVSYPNNVPMGPSRWVPLEQITVKSESENELSELTGKFEKLHLSHAIERPTVQSSHRDTEVLLLVKPETPELSDTLTSEEEEELIELSSQESSPSPKYEPEDTPLRSIKDELRATSYSPPAPIADNSIEQDDDEDMEELEELKNLVPSQYHDSLDIFRKREGASLPPFRPYDHVIELTPGSKLSTPPLYQLSVPEQGVLRDHLAAERKSGRSRPSKSPYGSPMFFVPKKDGRLRLVVDYRKLNAVTVKNVYPLPLISQILADLREAKYFTKLDLVGAYQLLRMAPGSEELTAYRTQYGMYESLVLRDGLCNAPASFQHFLNDIFRELIGQGVSIYIDDILIYAKTLEDLRTYTRKVFDIIRENNLYLKATKCEFEKNSMGFLGYVISNNGIHTDQAKVKSIKEFPTPKDPHEVRQFLGLAGYYRRFVAKFSQLSVPLTKLLRKDISWEWGTEQEKAFTSLVDRLCEAPILAHFNPTFPISVQADASHFGYGVIISQTDPLTKIEHPIAFDSGRFTPAEVNYPIGEKEFLSIVKAFTKHRAFLEGSPHEIKVYTDHRNLVYFMTGQMLTPRQARWTTMLSRFNFKIYYRPGKESTLPDALSRRPDYHPGKGATLSEEFMPGNYRQALPAFDDLEDNSELVQLRAIKRKSTLDLPEDLSRDFFPPDNEILAGLSLDPKIQPLREEMMSVICFSCDHPTCSSRPNNPKSYYAMRRDPRLRVNDAVSWSLNGFLLFESKIYVPDYKDLRLLILRSRHDSKLAGHPGIARTYELVSRDYYWDGVRSFVNDYVLGCTTCLRNKPINRQPYGHLKSLPVPQLPFEDLTMDFIEKLPQSGPYDSILVIVDRLTKYSIFIPTTTTLTAEGLADLYLSYVFSRHGLPKSIVCDRGAKFTSFFWKSLMERLNIKLNLSTAYHPQTDGQTERMNQTLEQYLRNYVTFEQDDWSRYLPLAQFVLNNHLHSSITTSPFFALHGYSPRWVDELNQDLKVRAPSAGNHAESMQAVHRLCREQIAKSNESMAKYYNARHRPTPSFAAGDKVLLSLQNVKSIRPTKKFDQRRAGPYEIAKAVSSHAYQLKLPKDMKIHNVFHVSLLESYDPPFLRGRNQPPPPPLVVDSQEEYEVQNILTSRFAARSKTKIEYLVEWKGYEGTDEATTWEPEENLKGSPDLLREFHQRYPDKPCSTFIPPIVKRSRTKA